MPVLPDSDSPAPPASDLIPWVQAADLNCSPCDIDADVVARAATIIADNLSGHQFGQRSIRLRPLTVAPSCSCYGVCGCGRVAELRFTEPVSYVSTVKVDGELLAAEDWVLYGDARLVRVDGGTFPCCQSLSADPDADAGTLEVACIIGSAPDDMAQLAVQEIACELVKAFDDPSSCRLPKRVQSMTRQQLSVNFVDPTNVLTGGFTGLPIVDLWLGSLDTDARRRPGRAVDLSRQTGWREPA